MRMSSDFGVTDIFTYSVKDKVDKISSISDVQLGLLSDVRASGLCCVISAD